MKPRLYYVMEDVDSAGEWSDGEIISLSPEACLALQKQGVPYQTMENFYRESELMAAFSDSFLRDQLRWFDDFDKYLWERIHYLRSKEIRLIYYLRYRLKYFLDSIIAQSYVFYSFFEKIVPQKIIYYKITSDDPVNSSLFHLADNKRKFFYPLMVLFCREKNIPLETVLIPKQSNSSVNITDETHLNHATGMLKFRDLLKAGYYYLKYHKYERLWKRDKKFENMSILFLSAGHKDCDPIIQELIAKGAKVYFKAAGAFYDFSSWRQNKIADLSANTESIRESILDDFKKAAENLTVGHPLIKWINEKCGLDMSSFILPYFQNFLEKECPRVASEVPSLVSFFNELKLNYVISRTANLLSDTASLIAGEQTQLSRRVCFQHGCFGPDSPIWAFSQAPYFDIFFATDPENREYSERTFPSFSKRNIHVHEYASFLEQKRSFSFLRNQRKRIYYVPTRNFIGVRMLNGPHMPTTWYYHLQISILNCLAGVKGKEFVFKYANSNDWTRATLAYLAWKKLPNIEVDDTPFWKCLDRAERVILDQIGTAFYETAVTDVPVLCLYYDETTQLRPESSKYFGKTLQPFHTFEDARVKIRNFINSDSDDFVINLPLTKENPVNTLLDLELSRKQQSSMKWKDLCKVQ